MMNESSATNQLTDENNAAPGKLKRVEPTISEAQQNNDAGHPRVLPTYGDQTRAV